MGKRKVPRPFAESGSPMVIDPQLDLTFTRFVDLPPSIIWQAWTQPEHLKVWFTPKPWVTVDAECDLRPGGAFRTTMRSPEGQNFDNAGCYLELVPDRRLVWTSMLQPGFRPVRQGGPGWFPMTAILTFEPEGTGTRYTAVVLHADAEGCATHAAMNFEEGWNKALEQLVAHVKGAALA